MRSTTQHKWACMVGLHDDRVRVCAHLCTARCSAAGWGPAPCSCRPGCGAEERIGPSSQVGSTQPTNNWQAFTLHPAGQPCKQLCGPPPCPSLLTCAPPWCAAPCAPCAPQTAADPLPGCARRTCGRHIRAEGGNQQTGRQACLPVQHTNPGTLSGLSPRSPCMQRTAPNRPLLLQPTTHHPPAQAHDAGQVLLAQPGVVAVQGGCRGAGAWGQEQMAHGGREGA